MGKRECVAYLVLVRYGQKLGRPDDGECRQNVVEGAAHHGWKPGSERGLEQGVDSGDKDDRLDDLGPLVLQRQWHQPAVSAQRCRHCEWANSNFELGKNEAAWVDGRQVGGRVGNLRQSRHR